MADGPDRIELWNPKFESEGMGWRTVSPQGVVYRVLPVRGGGRFYDGGWMIERGGVYLREMKRVETAKWGVRMDWEQTQGIITYPGGKKPSRLTR